jgi:two-component system, OmpR family, sensor histidine kinase MprB
VSFRLRVTLLTAVAVAVGIAVAAVVVYVTAERQLRNDADRDLRSRAAVLTAVLPSQQRPRLKLVQWMAITKKVQRSDPGQPEVFLQVNAPYLVVSAKRPLGTLPRQSTAAVERGGELWRTIRRDGVEYRVLALPFAGGVVQIARPLKDIDQSLHHLRLLLLWVALGGIGFAALVGALVSRAAVGPLRRLVAATDRVIATGELRERIGRHSRDEVGLLSSRFDQMLETLERSILAQRQLVADASHELRTPLASLRANLELLLADPSLEGAARDELVADVREELEALTSIMVELVDLARGEEQDVAAQPFRLDETVEAAVARVRRRAPDLTFRLDLRPTIVEAVPERIDRAVSNLLNNARKWTPTGGTVSVTVRDGAVAVEDSGPGVAEEDRPLIFERFYRATSARGTPGAGLGLAIVKQIAEASGGTISIENAKSGGAVFRLQLLEKP